jgi:hypothetical protein
MSLESAVRNVRDYPLLIALLASEPLYWDVGSSVGRDEMTFEWSAEDLKLSQSDAHRRPPSERRANPPTPIWVMAAIREAFPSGVELGRDAAIRAVAHAAGFQRTGSKIAGEIDSALSPASSEESSLTIILNHRGKLSIDCHKHWRVSPRFFGGRVGLGHGPRMDRARRCHPGRRSLSGLQAQRLRDSQCV